MTELTMNQLIRPMHDRVLVQRDIEETIEGGIILAGSAAEPQKTGVILALGADHCPFQVAVGDRVCFGVYAGVNIDHEGKPYILLKESEILGVIFD